MIVNLLVCTGLYVYSFDTSITNTFIVLDLFLKSTKIVEVKDR